MKHTQEELKEIEAALARIPSTDAEVESFMADVDAGKHDAVIAKSMQMHPPEETVAKLKAEIERLKLKRMEAEGITPEDLFIPYSERP